MSANPKKQKQLTGWHVLAMLLAFFGVMLAVNIFFTVAAVKTFSGEDVPRSYRQGLEYNQTLEARDIQNQLGWTAHVNYVEGRILLEIQNADGAPIDNLNISAKLKHPATLSNDQNLVFQQNDTGLYEAQIMGLTGQWQLVGSAKSGENEFRFEHDLWLS